MPFDIKNFRVWPAGPVPRFAKHWVLVGVIVVMIVFLAFCGAPRREKVTTRGGIETRPASREEVARFEAQLEQRGAELRARQKALADSLNARSRGDAEDDERRDQSGEGYRDPEPQQQIDPLVKAQQDYELEIYKKRQRREFADPQAFSLRSVYNQDKTAPAAPPEPAAEPEKKVPAAEIPAAPAETKYRLREGSFLETVLVNRLDSTFSGPVIVQVSNDVWARDRHTMLIPKGTQVIGEAKAVGSTGQSRVAVVFHRLLRGDDVAIDLDQFTGLNQIGETGLKDKVNNHYVQIFGVSIALGVIGAAAQGTSSYGFNTGGWDYARQGFGSGMSQAAMNVMNRFLNIPPTVTIREGHRIKVYFTQDLELPAYKGAE